MKIVATIAVVIVAAIHALIAVVEMFFWEVPIVHQRLDLPTEIAIQVTPIVQNAGLYNSFIAAGLIWGAFSKKDFLSVRAFFLGCVVVAGVFGALTLKPTTLVLQTIPASIALILGWFAYSRSKP